MPRACSAAMASSSVAASAARWALNTRLLQDQLQRLGSGVGCELLESLGREAQSPCVLIGVGEHPFGHVGKAERAPERIPDLAVYACLLADLARTERRRPEANQAPDPVLCAHSNSH